jgi:outer membrane protein OmpA-like peptidoglycan-associated protein
MKKILTASLVFAVSMNGFAQTIFENLGTKVNSIYSEVRPTISADGKTLYFVVEGNPKNTMYKDDKEAQDIWFSELDENGVWGQATQATTPLNGLKDNAVFWVSPDGNRILIRGAYENGKYVGRGVSLSNKTAGGWSTPQRLKIKGYSKMSQDKYSGAFMANDGKTLLLYFSEERNSFLNSLYVSFLEENDEWTMPRNLGPTINLEDYDQISPFLASDGATMYFSSDRPGGHGEHDIWMSKRLDESWTKWTEPVNMGDSINTAKWDAYFSLDAKGEYAYLASTQSSIGGTDLGKIKLSDALRPDAVVLVYGKVFNAITKEPMTAKMFYDKVPGETSEGNAISNPDGNYKVTLPYGKKYSLRASADSFFSVIDTLDISEPGVYKEIHRDLYLYPSISYGTVLRDAEGNVVRTEVDNISEADIDKLQEGQVLSASNILFDFNKSLLRSKSYKELDKIAMMMQMRPTMRVELSAHTDNVGSYSYNLQLSDDRAISAKQYLLSKGIANDRIIARGYGETTPMASNDTDEGRQLNRRVEFRILKK